MAIETAILQQKQHPRADEGAGERRRSETESPIFDGKSLVTLQFCMTCNRTFAPQRGRKRCPSCQDLLRSKILVITVHDPE